MRIAIPMLVAAVIAACGSDDEAAKREAERKALKEKAELLAKVTTPGERKPAPPPRSKEELVAACEQGDGPACQGACAKEHALSCSKLGNLFETGSGGVPENYESAATFHAMACDKGAGEGCYAMGLFYHIGKHAPANITKAKSYFEKGCELEFKPACAELEAMKKKK